MAQVLQSVRQLSSGNDVGLALPDAKREVDKNYVGRSARYLEYGPVHPAD